MTGVLQTTDTTITTTLHRKMAIDLFNFTWRLIEKEPRTREEEDTMVHAAHASRYHWGQVGLPLNLARGEWQVAHVYTILGRAEPALYHASRCLELCEHNGIEDFDIAYAHLEMARASAAAGDRTTFDHHIHLAEAYGKIIPVEGDRKQFYTDLESGPWFGFR